MEEKSNISVKEILGTSFSSIRPLPVAFLQDVLDEIHKLLSNIPEDKKNDKIFISMLIEDLNDYVCDQLRNLDYEDENDQEIEKECDTLVDDVLKSIITKDLSRDEDFFVNIIGSTSYYPSNLPYRILQFANPDLINNKEFMSKVIKENGFLIDNANEQLKNDEELILVAIKSTHNGIILKDVSEELKSNKDFMIKAVSQGSDALKYASESLRSDKDVVLEAVKSFPGQLAYASEDLRSDKEFVAKLLQNSYISETVLEYASEELKQDKDVVLIAVKHCGVALQYASEEFKNDKEVVLEAVSQDSNKQGGICLQYASEDLKADRDIIFAAVKHCGVALQYASEDLKNDREIVLEAIKDDERALKDAGNELRNDKNFILEAIMQNPNIPDYCIGEELQKDSWFMYEVSSTRQQAKDSEQQDDKHKISEIESTISDRKTEDINKVIAEISEKMQDKSKGNSPTINE